MAGLLLQEWDHDSNLKLAKIELSDYKKIPKENQDQTSIKNSISCMLLIADQARDLTGSVRQRNRQVKKKV